VDSKTKELSGYFYPLVKWLFDKKRKEYNLDSSDLITVIPGSKSTTISPTLRVIGELLSKDTGIPCDLIIERTRQSSWSQRNGVSRFSDVSGSMTLKRRLLGNEKKILLLDDTRTTGMTALECAKMLTAAGAEDAILICLGTNTSKEEVDK
jgi:predicted amidophosphoribosyltransferase